METVKPTAGKSSAVTRTRLGLEGYLDVKFLGQILHRQMEALVPGRVEAFVNHLTFVEGFSIYLEFHIRITGAWNRNVMKKRKVSSFQPV